MLEHWQTARGHRPFSQLMYFCPQMHKHVHLELTSTKRKKGLFSVSKKVDTVFRKAVSYPLFLGNIGLLGIVSKRGCQDKTNRWSPPGSGLRRGSDRQICTSHSTYTHTHTHSPTLCKHTERMPWYDMILPLGGHVKPCTYQCLARLTNLPQSLTPDPPLPLRNASERGSAFDICGRTRGGTTKGWKDLIFTRFYIFRFLKLICLYCKFITCNCVGCATHMYMPALR